MKTILITGGNRGIGLEVARQLIERGHRVVLGSRDVKSGADAIEKLNFPENIIFLAIDVSCPESIISASEELKEKGIKLDVIINNAAVLLDKSGINSMPPDLFLDTIKTNTLGPILIIQNFLSHLRTDGRIINVSSELGALSKMEDHSPAYSISKTALNAVTKQFASSLRSRNISVNSICPGWVRTDMGGMNANRSVEKGAETIVWMAVEAPKNISGKFLKDKKVIEW